MALTARLTALTLALTAAAAAVTALSTAGATPLPVRPSTVSAHDVVAPAPVRLTRPAAVVRTPARKAARVVHVARVVHKTRTPKAKPAAPRRAPRPAFTPEQLMRRAIARIPGYRPGVAVFTLEQHLSNWGIAELQGGTISIAARVPANRMYDVVAHEWSHVLSMQAYGGDVQQAMDAMNSFFGGSGLAGAEKAADCMARELGATWTHYTPCSNSTWRAGARRLIAGQAL